MTTTLFIPGTPVPQGSMKSFAYTPKGGGRPRSVVTSDNKQTTPWRAQIVATVREHVGPDIVYPDGPVALWLLFVMPRRASEPKRATPAHTRKPDGDKLTRAAFDALTGLLFADDSQVVEFTTSKRTAAIGEQPGLHLSWAYATTHLNPPISDQLAGTPTKGLF